MLDLGVSLCRGNHLSTTSTYCSIGIDVLERRKRPIPRVFSHDACTMSFHPAKVSNQSVLSHRSSAHGTVPVYQSVPETASSQQSPAACCKWGSNGNRAWGKQDCTHCTSPNSRARNYSIGSEFFHTIPYSIWDTHRQMCSGCRVRMQPSLFRCC